MQRLGDPDGGDDGGEDHDDAPGHDPFSANLIGLVDYCHDGAHDCDGFSADLVDHGGAHGAARGHEWSSADLRGCHGDDHGGAPLHIAYEWSSADRTVCHHSDHGDAQRHDEFSADQAAHWNENGHEEFSADLADHDDYVHGDGDAHGYDAFSAGPVDHAPYGHDAPHDGDGSFGDQYCPA